MRDIIFDLINLTCNIVMIICLIRLIAMIKSREEDN